MTAPDPRRSYACAECIEAGRSAARIGNFRGSCKTCNKFAQKVMRVTAARIRVEHARMYQRIRKQVELAVLAEMFDNA